MIIKRTKTRPTTPRVHRGFLLVRTMRTPTGAKWASVRDTDDLTPQAWSDLVAHLSPECCGEWTIRGPRGA